jgi:hypothetical protein
MGLKINTPKMESIVFILKRLLICLTTDAYEAGMGNSTKRSDAGNR